MSGQLQLLPAATPKARMRSLPLGQITGYEHAQPRPGLIAAIRRLGRLLEPVIVTTSNERTYTLIEGRRRVRAIALLAAEQQLPRPIRVPAIVLSADGIDGRATRAALTLLAHGTRSDSPVSELAAIEAILSSATAAGEPATIRQIATQTGMSVQTIRRRLRLRDLAPALRCALDSGSLGVSAGETAARLPQAQQQQLAEKLKAGEQITTNTVKQLLRAQATSAIHALPDSVFNPGLSWQASVAAHLDAALKALPEEGDVEQLAGVISSAFDLLDPL